MRLWWHLHWAFSLNSRAGLNVLWAKTLNIALFQVLHTVEDTTLIWSIFNSFELETNVGISLVTWILQKFTVTPLPPF